jgi:NADH dehydrogenase [ubiquinone] 1 alpha subcomplex assembly factor 5
MRRVKPLHRLERSLQCPLSLTRPETAQGRCRADPPQPIDLNRQFRPLLQPPRESRALVKAPLPQPPAMQGHGNEDSIARQPIRHNRRHRPRQSRSPRIFKAQCNATRNLAISNSRDDRIISGRRFQAWPADQSIMRTQRDGAVTASRRIQEMQLHPAFGAKTMIFHHNPRAPRTARRQHEIKNRARKGNKRSHLPVVDAELRRHKREMSTPPSDVPEVFDRKARRLRRGRTKGGGFFAEHMASDLLERLDDVKRDFKSALVVGAEPILIERLTARGIDTKVCDPSPRRAAWASDEDRIAASSGSFDLILSSGTLDTVNDLPGALVLLRRMLKPDGFLLANFAGAPSLSALRQAVTSADAEKGKAVARLHPQIDVRSAGDLLIRAGFALPVADIDNVEVAYSNLSRLLSDLREASATSLLKARYPVSPGWLACADAAFAALAGPDGKTHEMLSFITVTGWAPSPNQPKPAKRGSGTTSLAQLLDKSLD